MILRPVRATDLDFRAGKPLLLGGQRVLDQRRFGQMQPAALGRIERAAIPRSARKDPERQFGPLGAQIPQSRIDRRQSQRGNGADRRRVDGIFKFAPDRLDALGLLADEPGREMIGQQPHHRGAAGADRIAVAGSDRAIAVGDGDDRRLLRDKTLDRVGALDLRLEVDHPKFDAFDPSHSTLRPASDRRGPLSPADLSTIRGGQVKRARLLAPPIESVVAMRL